MFPNNQPRRPIIQNGGHMCPPLGSLTASPAHSLQQPSQNVFAQTPLSQKQIHGRYQPPRPPNQSQQGYKSSSSSSSWSSEYSNQSQRQPHTRRQPNPQQRQRLSQSGLGVYQSQAPVARNVEANRGASIPLLVNGGTRPLSSTHILPVVPFRVPVDNGEERQPVPQTVKESKDYERGHGYRDDYSLGQCHPVFMGVRKPVKLPNGVLSGGGMSPVATGYQFEEPLRRISGGGKL